MAIYGKRYQWIENLEDSHSDFYKTKLQQLLIDNIILIENRVSAKPVNLSDLEKNHRFKESLKYSYGYNTYMVERYKEIMSEVALLEQHIATELNQRQ
ncbi:MAG: hypothetical protein ACI8ZM_005696 [Crocinitomix sp.]|jgi:hypothetical protein